MAGEKEKVRVNVTFGPRYYGYLEEMSTMSGSTKADVLRDAIAFRHWVNEVKERGGRLLVEDRSGALAEVVIKP